MYSFNARNAADGCIHWIRTWFEENGKDSPAIIGISGGKDSSVVAALCCAALGAEKVVGVLMPCGEQNDISYAHMLCDSLGIKNYTVNIGDATAAIRNSVIASGIEPTVQANTNLPPRIRMSTLYAVSQSLGGRVANTCNLSEDWIGYSTRYGDAAGDFSPISCFTVAEVLQLGALLGLPEVLIQKPPSDGLCGKTDEDNLGFSYATLDAYIREGVLPSPEIREKIDRLHKANLFKLSYMASYVYK